MVAHFTMRAYGVNQAFRFVEGIWLHRKSRQIRFYVGKSHIFHHVLSYHIISVPWIISRDINQSIKDASPQVKYKPMNLHLKGFAPFFIFQN